MYSSSHPTKKIPKKHLIHNCKSKLTDLLKISHTTQKTIHNSNGSFSTEHFCFNRTGFFQPNSYVSTEWIYLNPTCLFQPNASASTQHVCFNQTGLFQPNKYVSTQQSMYIYKQQARPY